jgi:hypothetical protein
MSRKKSDDNNSNEDENKNIDVISLMKMSKDNYISSNMLPKIIN